MAYSKIQHETHLNELYNDCYSEEEAVEQLSYLNSGKIKESSIRNAYRKRQLGTLLRKYDPIAFIVSYQDHPKYRR